MLSYKNDVDFDKFVDAYYLLSAGDRTSVFENDLMDKHVKWTATIADLDSLRDSVIFVQTQKYNGQNWDSLFNGDRDSMPYSIVLELKDLDSKKSLKVGDEYTFTGVIGARGDIGMCFNWKLYEGEVLS